MTSLECFEVKVMEQNDKDKIKPTEDGHQLAWSQEIPNYGNKLLKRLDEFRKTTILYDVKVRADGGDFNAHKVILAACGGLFRTCFVDEKKKMISSEIAELRLDCPAQGLKPIIRFAYTGALVVTKRNAVATMIAAEVTKMKEVQEICAEIAVKEYGWVIHFAAEKNAATIESLGKVLQLHAPCFTTVPSNGNHVAGNERALPFAEEVEKEFSEHTTTYQRLATKLESAKALMAASEPETKDNSEKAKSEPAPTQVKNEVTQSAENPPSAESQSLKEDEPTSPKPPVPHQRPGRTKSDEAKDINTDAKSDNQNVSNGNTPKKSTTPPPPQVKSSDASNPKPPRPPVAHKKTKSDATDSNDGASNDVRISPPLSDEKTLKKPSPSSPRTQVKDPSSSKPSPNATPKKPTSGDEKDTLKITVTTDENESSDASPKKPAPPRSPRVKPRSSVKSKKAAPAPPPPTLAPPAEKSPKAAAPPRPKAPIKVPPPRPKPPSTKKSSTDPDGTPTMKQIEEIAGDYDESLNPFA